MVVDDQMYLQRPDVTVSREEKCQDIKSSKIIDMFMLMFTVSRSLSF